jgi:hypothetical protein
MGQTGTSSHTNVAHAKELETPQFSAHEGQYMIYEKTRRFTDQARMEGTFECLSSPEAQEAASAAETLVALSNTTRSCQLHTSQFPDTAELFPDIMGIPSLSTAEHYDITTTESFGSTVQHGEHLAAELENKPTLSEVVMTLEAVAQHDGTSASVSQTDTDLDSESDLEQFQNEVHTYTLDDNGNKIHKCSICCKVFTVMTAFRGHVSAHFRQKNKCGVCAKQFFRCWLLKGHMRTHTGERPYQCEHPGCDKAFADKSNLRSHALIHTTKGKSFVCTKCHRAFAQKRYLHKHKLEVCK